jgi:hypothetical protein
MPIKNREIIQTIRILIQEEIGRNLRSINTNPIAFDKAHGIVTVVDYLTDLAKWSATIKHPETGQLTTRYFSAKEDADMWVRNNTNKLAQSLMNEC